VNDRRTDTAADPRIPWKLVGLIVLAAIALLFVLQNRNRAPVQFLFFEINSRQWVNIVVAIVVGVLLDRLFLGWWRRRTRAD
jgi:uncharacterized integral membrane protein